jgi:hypothetical protein
VAIAKRVLRLVVIAVALHLGAGCQAESAHAPAPTNSHNASKERDMRTTVPLVRQLGEQDIAEPIELEFDVPSQANDPDPPIFVGLRLTATDPAVAAARTDQLRDAGVTAEVHLYRLSGTSVDPVTLQRSELVGRSEFQVVALDADGKVPGFLKTDSDFRTMQAAGLIAPNAEYRELEMAFLRDTPPGRYRVVIRFGGNVQALSEAHPELLIAFTAKSM